MSKPLLSIGMIVKNEIRCIEKCLQALAPLREAIPCELVIADTGSDDGTRAVIERYADLVFDFPWIKDFSAARNAVMDRCTGQWYLSVDADEYLDPDISQLEGFLRAKEPKANFAMVIQRNYASASMEEGDYGDFKALRLARLTPDVRFQGAIHEVWATDAKTVVHLLDRVILHHDGYAGDNETRSREKSVRNMELLRAELREQPHNMRTLLQCVESSGAYPQEMGGYVCRGMELLLSETVPATHPFSAPLWRNAIQWACDNDLPELETWLAWGREHYAQTAFLRLDVSFFMAAYCYNHKQYEKALEWGERYRQGYKDYLTGRISLKDEAFSVLKTNRPRVFCQGTNAVAGSMEKLGRGQEALAVLAELDIRACDEAALRSTLMVLRDLHRHPDCAEKAAIQCAQVMDLVLEDSGDSEESKKKRTVCLTLAAQMFAEGDHGLFARVKGDLGLAARAMDEVEPEKLTQLLAEIQGWKEVPNPVVLHGVEFGAVLPERFYRRGADGLRNIASALGTRPCMPRALLHWVQTDHFDTSMRKFQFLFELTAATLRGTEWKKQPDGVALCDLFIRLAADYLPNYYNGELLSDETEWSALPGLHVFALWLLKGVEQWEQGDELGYVRSLRAGLDAAPAMKGMVDFLLEHKPKTAAQRQLEELAEQVGAILAQYTPDDPAVIALKESEVYQKVAPLLEQQKLSGVEPQTDDSPISPTLLEEALSGTKEEIAASMREHIDRWGEINAERRTSYWEKFPLWGRNTEETVENAAATLSTHRDDFRWLFDRLGDERSRRILTAVVRSWRFYETDALSQVKEQTYDDYFDLSLLHCDANEVVADLGAFVGDTFHSYVKNYGSLAYRRYYAYEITKESIDKLRKASEAYPRVVLRRKGAGDGPGMMTLDANADASANTLTDGTCAGETVEIVALDDDITEPITLIKMDIEGAEQAALRGCARHIREDRPKLALSVYHNFEDLWKLPRMIEEQAPGYRFYLRYHGGNLWPSEITLLAIPAEV